jgi:hypothetical protein
MERSRARSDKWRELSLGGGKGQARSDGHCIGAWAVHCYGLCAIVFEVPLIGALVRNRPGGTLSIARIPLHRPTLLKKYYVDEWVPSNTRARDFLGVGGGGLRENEAQAI